jgi:Protein of unknown function (DUF1488)
MMAMDAISSDEPVVVDGGRAIAFEVIAAGRVVKCTVSREALQDYFWLQPDADNARMLKIFNDGRHRIIAIAERRARRLAAESIHLDVSDFR